MKTPDWIRNRVTHRGTRYPAKTIGVEIEVEGRRLPKALFNHWLIHDDGSLRGEDNCEYVLRAPLKRKEVEEALNYLEEKFKEEGAILDTESDRTSVHIHLNVQDKSWTEVFTIWTLWSIVEDLSFELCGDERRGNLFCLRLKDAEGTLLQVRDSFKNNSYPFQNNEWRYAACNLQAVYKFGSIEFRAMHGTVDKKEILTWIDFLIKIFTASEKFDNPHEIIQKFSQVGPRNFLTEILELTPEMVKSLTAYPDYQKSLWEGMRLAQDVAWILTDWGKKIDKSKEEKLKRHTIDIIEDALNGVELDALDPLPNIRFAGIDREGQEIRRGIDPGRAANWILNNDLGEMLREPPPPPAVQPREIRDIPAMPDRPRRRRRRVNGV